MRGNGDIILEFMAIPWSEEINRGTLDNNNVCSGKSKQ